MSLTPISPNQSSSILSPNTNVTDMSHPSPPEIKRLLSPQETRLEEAVHRAENAQTAYKFLLLPIIPDLVITVLAATLGALVCCGVSVYKAVTQQGKDAAKKVWTEGLADFMMPIARAALSLEERRAAEVALEGIASQSLPERQLPPSPESHTEKFVRLHNEAIANKRDENLKKIFENLMKGEDFIASEVTLKKKTDNLFDQ